MAWHWKMHTNFPFTRVFVLGIILFFLGFASMIISVIAFVTESWGHYVATGMWGGASILASGSTAIFSSRLKSLASVRTLLVCSVLTTFTSLTMLILSAGGLSLSSGFYNRIDPSEYNKRTSNLIHASLLVISVFCLSGNVLAVIVCSKYLFFEPYDKSKHRRRQRHLPEGTIRVSTSLRGGAPTTSSVRTSASRPHHLLLNEHPVRRHSENTGVNRVQIEYRRAHRRSSSDQANSQQLHLHSQSRRHRHSHQETALSINGTSATHPQTQSGSSRSRHGRHSSRGMFNHDKPSKAEAGAERFNTSPGRHSSPRSPSNQATLQIRMAPSQISSRCQQIRLPTEFDEEELPPYEPTDSSQPQNSIRCSDCDSGAESDSENSSSTDAHSYDAVELCVEGAEAVPMVNLRHSRTYRSRRNEQSTHFPSIPLSSPEVDVNRRKNAVRRSRTFDYNDRPFKQSYQRRSSNSDQMLNQNSQARDQLGEYECLISVSPEVCAITGESSVVNPQNDKIPHLVHENPYENGPCYENVRAIGLCNTSDEQLNPLSKSCTSTTEQKINSSASNSEHKVTASMVSARVVPVQTICQHSNDSPINLRSSFGSPNSAFRPVKPSQSPLHIHHSTSPHQGANSSFVSLPPNMRISPLDNTPTPAPLTEAGTNGQSNMSEVTRYVEQGAIPKTARQQNQNFQKEETSSLSWKNIPLPLSYNHSDSLSNDEEKKLPSKQIPFAESNENPLEGESNYCADESNGGIHESNDNGILISNSNVHNPNSLSLPSPSSHLPQSSSFASHPLSAEPPTIPTEMISSAPALSFSLDTTVPTKAKERTLITTQPLSPPTQTSSSLSSLALASLQETSFLRSRPLSHRMGGNQFLLQSRRDELRNLHTNHQHTRGQRPSSLIDDQHLTASSNDRVPISPNSPQDRNTPWSPADRTHPLSLSTYLMGQHRTSQNYPRRQPLDAHQHHVPQPQQPRLGVQLQRRPQHFVMMNNNEQFQEPNFLHHQHPQPQPVPQEQRVAAQADNGQQQARSSRPLFSLLL